MSSQRVDRWAPAAVVAATFVAASAFIWHSSNAAFTSQLSTGTSNFTAGRVDITSTKAGQSVFSATGLRPGSTETACVDVAYQGNLAAEVRLYPSALTGTLAPYLTWTAELLPAGAACATTATTTALATGVTLQAFVTGHDSYPTGYTAAAWRPTAAETRTYRFTYTLQDQNAAQGLTAGVVLNWQSVSL